MIRCQTATITRNTQAETLSRQRYCTIVDWTCCCVFHWNNSSGRTMVDSVSNRNDYQEYFLGGRRGVNAAWADGWQTYQLLVPTVLKAESLILLETSVSVQTSNGIALPFHRYICSFQTLYLRPKRAVSLTRSAQEGSISGQTLRPQCSVWSNLKSVRLRLENVCVSDLFGAAAAINTSGLWFNWLPKKVEQKTWRHQRIAVSVGS